MGFDVDPKFDKHDAVAIKLGGHEFYVAPVPLRQIIALADHIPKMRGLTADNVNGTHLLTLVEVMWRGLVRAHPKLTKDELLDLPIRLDELMAALPAVIQQAGGKQVAAPGEVEASRSTPSTGNGLSPASSSTSTDGLETRS